MSFRPIIQQFDRQPSPNSCEIDWDHPITKELVGAWLPAGNGFVDMVDGTPPSSVTATTFGTGRLGAGVFFNSASNSVVQYPHKSRYAVISPRGMTVVAALRCDTASGVKHIIGKQGSSTTNAPFEFRMNHTSGSFNPVLLRAAAGSFRGMRSVSNIWSAGQEIVLAVSVSDNITDTLGTLALDGDFTAMQFYGGSGSTAVTDNGADVYIGRRYDGGTEFDGAIYAIYLFNRSLLLDELKAITTRPWQVFA